MSRSFLASPRYKLNPSEFQAMVDRVSSLIPAQSEQSQQMKKRFLSLCRSDFASATRLLLCFEGMMRRENESFPLPSKRESALILAYTRFILAMDGRWDCSCGIMRRVNEEFFTVVFRAVEKIPFYITTGIQKSDYYVLSDFVKVFLLARFTRSPF